MQASSLIALIPALAFATNPAQTVRDVGGIVLPQPDPVHWERTPASGIEDVAIAESGTIWVAGANGTIWHSDDDGHSFTEEDNVSGFGRIAAGKDDGYVFAVGRDNHTLWQYKGPTGSWTQTPATDVADVAIDYHGSVWIAGTNGTIWYSRDKGQSFRQIKANGFCRVATHSEELWAVGCNGTLWRYKPARGANPAWDAGEWIRTEASGIADVAGDNINSLWLTGKNGTAWERINKPLVVGAPQSSFVKISPPAGFASIAVGDGRVYAVRLDGTLWRLKR